MNKKEIEEIRARILAQVSYDEAKGYVEGDLDRLIREIQKKQKMKIPPPRICQSCKRPCWGKNCIDCEKKSRHGRVYQKIKRRRNYR